MPALGEAVWRAMGTYDRAALSQSVMMFGTGGLLRALVAAAVDDANRAGRTAGTIVAVQSTPGGWARTLNRQDGLFTLVERGGVNAERIERTRIVGAITRALVAADEWSQVRDVAASSALRVIVSNVTEAGFRSGPDSYAEKLTDLLRTRFERAPEAPPLAIIPTELVADNGARLATMVDEVVTQTGDRAPLRNWIAHNVTFCSSLVDRITTGIPTSDDAASLATRLGYTDDVLTVTEPDSLWAIEGDPLKLTAAFPVSNGDDVVFAPNISFHRTRKIRLLNGAHTAMAPLALLAGVATVRDATVQEPVVRFFRHLLFEELVPASGIPLRDAEEYAQSVWKRFANPWLAHAWTTIATNQSEKFAIRVVPSIVEYAAARGRAPAALSLACAGHLRHLNATVPALHDATLWGARLDAIPGFADTTSRWMDHIATRGATSAINTFFSADQL